VNHALGGGVAVGGAGDAPGAAPQVPGSTPAGGRRKFIPVDELLLSDIESLEACADEIDSIVANMLRSAREGRSIGGDELVRIIGKLYWVGAIVSGVARGLRSAVEGYGEPEPELDEGAWDGDGDEEEPDLELE